MSMFGVADTIGLATRSIGDAIATDLKNAATVASMGGSFEVDLEALYRYYGKLNELYEHVSTLLTDAQAAPAASDAASSRIVGVTAANKANVRAWNGANSLVGSLSAIQAELVQHLSNLRDSYVTYIKADQDGAQRLTAAANPELAQSVQASTSKPTGWGS